MDTEGLLYSGVSATVFANAKGRFDAMEVYTDWKGGIYPAINSAGSISGVDYIIAYLLIMHKGLSGLRKQTLKAATTKHKETREFPAVDLLSKFVNGMSKDDIHSFFNQSFSEVTSSTTWNDQLLSNIVGITLSIFNAERRDYKGAITSGGTESIRLAVQAYSDQFKLKIVIQSQYF